jgi:hypothetical protein
MFYTSTCGFYLWYLIYVLYEQILGSFSLLVCFVVYCLFWLVVIPFGDLLAEQGHQLTSKCKSLLRRCFGDAIDCTAATNADVLFFCQVWLCGDKAK